MEKDFICGTWDDPIGHAFKLIEGKWKLPVLYALCGSESMRYSELKKSLDITNMMLTSTLKELEADGLVLRTQYNEVPPRVEYSATKQGRKLLPALKELRMWGEMLGNASDTAAEKRALENGKSGGSGAAGINGGKGFWKFQYEDGTWVEGSVVTDPVTGEAAEVPKWECINDAWWSFGADGRLKCGLIYDAVRQGWFYVDRNNGMKTGWAVVDGRWRYFEPSPHSATGRMAVDTWIDGWYVDENGVWDGKDRLEREDMEFSDECVPAQLELDVIKAIADARTFRSLTQKELAEKTGINQADISKLENGSRNPSIAILKRLARGMDMNLKIEFVPKTKSRG